MPGCDGPGTDANRRWQQIERTGGGTHLARGDTQVPSRGGQTAMAEQQLNGTNVGSGFQQMHCEGVAEGVFVLLIILVPEKSSIDITRAME